MTDVLTVKQAALLLNVSVSTIQRMLRDEILHPSSIKAGSGRGVTVIPKSEVEHYKASLKQTAHRKLGTRGQAAS